MNTLPRLLAVAALCTVAPGLVACASYAERTDEALAAFRRGDVDEAAEGYGHDAGSAFLEAAEAGTVLLADGRWREARAKFEQAVAAVEDLDSRALVSASDLAEGLGSWVLNDTVRAYEGEGFERVYLHVSLALTYLAEGLVDDVAVEARLANRLLETEEALYETEYRAGGMGHLLSALVYELKGEPDEAWIDYARMEAKGVGTELAGPALVRLARTLHRDGELTRFAERYGDVAQPPADAATIVVLGGVGLGPYKVEKGLAVETFDGLLKVVAPALERRGQPVGSLRLVVDGEGSVRTAVVEEVHDVAEENLEDRVLWMAAKSVARTVAKREATEKLQDEWGLFGRIVGDVFNAASERADLRFWQTLPDTWQAARLYVTPGPHHLRLGAGAAGSADLGTFDLAPGETMFVFARTVDTRLFAHAIGGRPVAAEADTSLPPVEPLDEDALEPSAEGPNWVLEGP